MGRYTGKSCRLICMLTTTMVFFSAEIVTGYIGNSIALISDSFNMLSDIISLSVGLIATRVRRRIGSRRCTYGLARVEVVGAMGNAVFLAALCFSICMQALKRLAQPEPIDRPSLVLVVGAVGLGINLTGLLVFQDWSWLTRRWRRKCQTMVMEPDDEGGSDGKIEEGIQQKDFQEEIITEEESQPLNIKGVLLHVLNDALGSLVVVVTSALFYVYPVAPGTPCGWQCYVDPSLTLVMVAIIMSSAAPLVLETTSILLHIVPRDLIYTKVLEDVCRLHGVLSVHDAHLWVLTKGRNVATLHVRISPDLHHHRSGIVVLQRQIREVFHNAKIHSVTIQLEYAERGLEGIHCSNPCMSPSCLKISCCPADVPALSVCRANLALHPEEQNEEKHDSKNVFANSHHQVTRL